MWCNSATMFNQGDGMNIPDYLYNMANVDTFIFGHRNQAIVLLYCSFVHTTAGWQYSSYLIAFWLHNKGKNARCQA